jgi:HPt (histidine-containing phosphotransfer) domain-containing protein
MLKSAAGTSLELNESCLAAIRKLEEPGGPDLVAQIIGIYLDHATRLLAELKSAATQNDLISIERCAHTLKSNSAQLGAERFAEVCSALERMAQTITPEALSDFLLHLEQEYERVRMRLRDQLRPAY